MTSFIKSLYAKCKFHGVGDAQVMLSDSELYALVCIAIQDLGWNQDELGIFSIHLPQKDYYAIDLEWFEKMHVSDIDTQTVIQIIDKCFHLKNDFALYIENLAALHRRRVEYKRILATQPLPTMDQIGPRVLLEYGCSNTTLLANWMVWRKWIYDIDNRAAQETGYLFEPLLASCLGGAPIGAKNSPVKRLDQNGKATSKGRQVDCLVPSNNKVYELKLRVTIAASGQGRFAQELSFAEESKAAGFRPVLLVLDPTHSDKLTELSEKFLNCGGEFYHGEAAWQHIEEEAGKIISIFVEKYIKPAIRDVETMDLSKPHSLTIKWEENHVTVIIQGESYKWRLTPIQ